jgi:hypothetical protein
MRLEDRRGLKISMAAFFFCICLFSVSMGQDDNSTVIGENSSLNLATEDDSLNITSENASLSLTTSENDSLVLVDENASSISAGENPSIKISDSLTLYSGDIITLQANDFTYLARHSARWASLIDRYESCLKVSDEPDAYGKFIVETVGNNQIRLRDADTKRYLYLVDYNGPSKNLDWYLKKNIFASYAYVFGLPFIKIEGIRPNNMCLFKVEVINNSLGGDMIALKASNGYYLKYGSKTPPGLKQKPVKIITANSGYPKDEYDKSVFTVTRTGVSSDYVQSISDVNFNLSSLKLSTKPSVIIQLEPHENTGDSERHFTITDNYLTRKTNKWTFERGIEFAVGTTISASLEKTVGLSFEGASAEISEKIGIDVTTTITKSEKNTNECEEEETHEVAWTQDIPIPPHTSVSAKIIATEATVDVPFTARVYVMARNTSNYYSYPINGTYQGTRCLTVKADITEAPLNQTSAITPNASQAANRPVFITSNPYRV